MDEPVPTSNFKSVYGLQKSRRGIKRTEDLFESSFHPALFLSLCLAVSRCVSLCLPVSHCVSLCLAVSHCVSLCLPVLPMQEPIGPVVIEKPVVQWLHLLNLAYSSVEGQI